MADNAPSVAMEAVLKRSCDLPENMTKIRGYDFNQGCDLKGVMKSYLTTGFQASRLGLAIQEINHMVRICPSRFLLFFPETPHPPVDTINLLTCYEQIEKRLEPSVVEEEEHSDKSLPGCTIFLGYTSNLISSGVRESIRYLAEHKMVHSSFAPHSG